MSKELKDFKKHMEITKRKIKVMEEMRDLKGRLSLYSRLELEYYNNHLQYLKCLKMSNSYYKTISDNQENFLNIIKEHKLLNYVLKNPKCAKMYNLTEEEINLLERYFR